MLPKTLINLVPKRRTIVNFSILANLAALEVSIHDRLTQEMRYNPIVISRSYTSELSKRMLKDSHLRFNLLAYLLLSSRSFPG